MSMPLTVRTERRGDGRVVLRAAGEIDASNIATFSDALSAATAEAADTFTVDLTGVEYLDSAAINALVPHADSLHIIANPVLIPVLRVSGLAELATVRPASDL